MANTKISALPINNNPTGNEEFVYADNNTNGKMTASTLKTFIAPDMSLYATKAEVQAKQDTLVSGTNIKTVNGNSLLGSGNIIISGGGGGGGSGGVISLNASENIAAGTLVSYDGGVKKLRRGFYGTASTGVTLTVNQQQYNIIDSVSVGSNTTVVVYMNGNWNIYAVAITWSGDTRTVGTPVQINTTNSCIPYIASPYAGEFIVTYRDSNNDLCVRAGSVAGTTITLGTETKSSIIVKGHSIVRQKDADSRSFVLFYTKNNDSKLYYNICTYDGTLACTIGTESLFRGNTCTTNHIGVGYLGGGNACVIREYQSGGTYYTDIVYASVSGATISGSNYLHLYTGTYAQIGYSPKAVPITSSLFLVDAGVPGLGEVFFLESLGTSSTPLILQQKKLVNTYPVAGRSYCCEDYDKGILGAFINYRNQSGKTQLSYLRFKGDKTGLNLISEIVLGTTSAYSIPTVTRQGITSVCSYIDGTNNVLGNKLFQDESDLYIGALESAATSGSPVDVTFSGPVTSMTSLTGGKPLYIGIDGAVSQTGADGGKQIGVATGSTDALLM